MAPLQVPKNFKFKLFFNGEPNATSNSLPHVAFNVQAAFSSTISPSSSSNPKSRKNGKEHVEFVEPLEKKPRKSYEKTHVFQDTWACCFPWVEIVVREDGLAAHVQCKICSNIEGKPKLLAPKFNTLQKHARCRKGIVPNFGIIVEDYFYYKDVAHAKNERTYFVQNSKSIMTLMQSRIHLSA
jgi:hypothetical protein